jgi:hypothetical protein
MFWPIDIMAVAPPSWPRRWPPASVNNLAFRTDQVAFAELSIDEKFLVAITAERPAPAAPMADLRTSIPD